MIYGHVICDLTSFIISFLKYIRWVLSKITTHIFFLGNKPLRAIPSNLINPDGNNAVNYERDLRCTE